MKKLPPPAVYLVVVTHKVGKEKHHVFSVGDTEAQALCALAKRDPDGMGISTSTWVSTETFIVPRHMLANYVARFRR
jgi:hypothetical protein